MQTIHQRTIDGMIDGEIIAVISNNPKAAGLDYAKQHQLPTHAIDHRSFSDRLTFDQQLIDQIDVYEPDYLILAGFMRILTAEFVSHYEGRLINIHPSLLPKFQGLHTHQRAIEAGDNEHGASVHFVTAELDAGPVIMQVRIPLEANVSADALQQAVLTVEHQLYPQAIALLCTGRIKQRDDLVYCDEEILSEPLQLV